MYSGNVAVPTVEDDGYNNDNDNEEPYARNVYVTFASRKSKENTLDKLHRHNEDVGKTRSRRMPVELESEADCTDAYGRKEVDATGTDPFPRKRPKQFVNPVD